MTGTTGTTGTHACKRAGRCGRAARLLALLAVVGVGLGAAACHGWRHKSPEERAAFAVEKVTDKLDLDAEQQAALKSLADEAVQFHKEMRAARLQEREWAFAQIGGDTLDQARILELLDAHQARVKERAPSLVAKLAQFHATLTPEQKAEATDVLKKLQKRFGGAEDDDQG